jgi:DNA polymerase-3 subunit alpha
MEFEAFGFYLQNHPLGAIREELTSKAITFSGELEKDYVEDGCTIKMAGVVISTSIKTGPKGRYAFISLSDPDGLVEVSLFNNEMITQHKDWIDGNLHNRLMFTCVVRKDDGGIRVSAKDFMLLDEYLKNTKVGGEKIKKAFKKGGDFDYKSFNKVEKQEDPILAKKKEEESEC